MFGVSVFRPTSIFLHTGKFGQAIFFLFLIAFALYQARPGRISRLALIVSFVGILISGQRAGMVAALIVLAAYLTLVKPRVALRLGVIAAFVVPLALVLAVAFDGVTAVLGGVQDRLFSTFTSADARFVGNSQNWGAALDQAGLFGAGVGSYSLGGGIAGGISFQIFGENAWMRFATEWGIVGSFVVLAVVIVSALPSGKLRGGPGLLFVNFILPSVLCAVWCLTHDLLANYLSVAYFGLYLGIARGLHAGPISSGQNAQISANAMRLAPLRAGYRG